MFRLKIQNIIALTLFVFVGQTVAMPLMNCCMENENTKPESHEMAKHHAMHAIDMPANNDSDMTVTNAMHQHSDEVNCNHQCDICLGTVLLEEFAAISSQTASAQLDETYHFYLPASSTDNPFRPPIFA